MKHETALTTTMPRDPDASRRARPAVLWDLPGSATDRWEDEGGHIRATSRNSAGAAPMVARIGETFPYRWARLSPLKFFILVMTGVAA